MSVSFGLTSGFLCHYWYNFLDKKIPGKSISIVARKIIYDQILFSPFLIVACLVVAGIIEASTKEEIIRDIQTSGTKLYLAEWIIWPPAQFFNFYFLPTRFRVFYDNVISLGYDMYTSHVKHSGGGRSKEQPTTTTFNVGTKADESTTGGGSGDQLCSETSSSIPTDKNSRPNKLIESLLNSVKNSKSIWSLNLNFDTGDW